MHEKGFCSVHTHCVCTSLQMCLRCLLKSQKSINSESNENCTIIYCNHKRHMNVRLRITNRERFDLLWYRPLAEKDDLYAQRCALLA